MALATAFLTTGLGCLMLLVQRVGALTYFFLLKK